MTIVPTKPRGLTSDLRKLTFPVLWTAIQPGVRVCCTPDRGPISTNEKHLANRAITFELSRFDLYGLEGDIVAGTLDDTRRLIADPMGQNISESAAKFIIRDDFTNPELTFEAREAAAETRVVKLASKYPWLSMAPYRTAMNDLELANYEALVVTQGYDGIYARTMRAPYRNGRSGVRDGSLVALRRFKRATGRIMRVDSPMESDWSLKVSCEEFPPFALRLGIEKLSAIRATDLVGRQIEFAYMAGDPAQPIKPILQRLLEPNQ